MSEGKGGERDVPIHIDGDISKLAEPVGELTHHRFRFYKNVWSTFDSIEKCTKPATCIGCIYKHPRCDEKGRVPTPLNQQR